MVVDHWTGGTGAQMENLTGFDALADQYGFFVAYPDSVGAQWDLSGNGNDVDFTVALLQTIEAKYHIDPTRVYLAGYSQGAGLAQAVTLCDTSLIAGFADVDTINYPNWQNVCQASLPVTYLLFHGTADPISPYYGGGVNGNAYSALQTATIWAQTNGCANSSNPSVSTYSDTLNTGAKVVDTRYSWTNCAGGTTAGFYSITGGGHTWPGGTQRYNATLGPASQGTDASLIMWQAFSPHRSPTVYAGVCGAANGASTSSKPVAGLCMIGLASSVTSGSGWSWTCSGYNGGAQSKCSAPSK
jgi:polyhydroxybutyrate depolymerase